MLVLPRASGELTPPTLDQCVEQEQAAGFPLGAFHQRWLIENRASADVRALLAKGRANPDLRMVRQGFEAFISNDPATAAFAAINTSLAELNMLGATQAIINQFCAIPANDPVAGKTYQIKLNGTYGNTGTPTMIFTPRWGSSTTPATNISLGPNSAWTSITGTTGLPYLIVFEFTVRTSPPGATLGTGIGFGTVTLGIPLTSSQVSAVIPIGGTAATIDTTGQGGAGCGLTMNLTWSASSVSNTSTCQQAYPVRSLN
jgi:hypothetical protein